MPTLDLFALENKDGIYSYCDYSAKRGHILHVGLRHPIPIPHESEEYKYDPHGLVPRRVARYVQKSSALFQAAARLYFIGVV